MHEPANHQLSSQLGFLSGASLGRKGFGSDLIERGLARELDADVSVDYDRPGVLFTLKAGYGTD